MGELTESEEGEDSDDEGRAMHVESQDRTEGRKVVAQKLRQILGFIAMIDYQENLELDFTQFCATYALQ